MLAAGACLCGINQSGCLVVIWSSRFAIFGPIPSTLHNKGPLRPPHESGDRKNVIDELRGGVPEILDDGERGSFALKQLVGQIDECRDIEDS